MVTLNSEKFDILNRQTEEGYGQTHDDESEVVEEHTPFTPSPELLAYVQTLRGPRMDYFVDHVIPEQIKTVKDFEEIVYTKQKLGLITLQQRLKLLSFLTTADTVPEIENNQEEKQIEPRVSEEHKEEEKPSFENVYLDSEFTVDGKLFKLDDQVFGRDLHNDVTNDFIILNCPKSVDDMVTLKNILTNQIVSYTQEQFLQLQTEEPVGPIDRELTDDDVGVEQEKVEDELKTEETPARVEAEEVVAANEAVAVEPPPIPNMPSPEPPPIPLTAQMEYLRSVEGEIDTARSAYATLLVQWKNKNRAQKGKFAKVLSDLGVEKQMPELAKSPELIEAEKNYRQAKRKKLQFISNKGDITVEKKKMMKGEFDIPIGETTEKIIHTVRENLIEEVEYEQQMLQNMVNASNSPIEKGKITRTLEWINKKPLWQRAAATSALLSLAGVMFGSIGLAGAATYAGYRTVRSVAGTTVGMAAGKYVDGVFKKANKEDREKVLNQYVANLQHGFEEKQEEQDEVLEKYFNTEEQMKKLQKTVKTFTVVGVAGVTNVGLGAGMSHYAPEVTQDLGVVKTLKEKMFGHEHVTHTSTHPALSHESSALHHVEHETVLHKSSPFSHAESNHIAPKVSPIESTPLPKVSVEHVQPVDVELSSRGFIATFDDMKTKLIHQYGSADHVPDQYKHFVKTPSDQLAQEFGFYDAQHHLSGVGLKGEHLSIDEKGIHYEKLSGKVFDINKEHTFSSKEVGGKMFETKPTLNIAETPTETAMRLKGTALGHTLGLDHDHANDLGGGEGAHETFVKLDADNYGDVETSVQHLHDAAAHEFVAPNLGSPDSALTAIASPESLDKILNTLPKSLGVEFNHGTAHLALVDAHDGQHLVIKGFGDSDLHKSLEIAHETQIAPNGPKILKLDDMFQDPKFSAIREIYSKAFDQNVDVKALGKSVATVSFEDGKMHVVQGIGNNPHDVTVLLNGKEIARGSIENGHSTVKMLADIPKRNGWWAQPTVYQEALKKAQSTLNQLQKNSKVA